MRFEYEGMSLWYGTADAPAPEGDVQAGSELMITVGVKPWNAGNRVVVLYRVNHGSTEQITARWIRNDARQKVQYFRAPFPSFRVGDTVEYLVVCRRAGRQLVPPPTQPEYFVSSFTVRGIGARQEPGSVPQLQALATNTPGVMLPFLRPVNGGQGDGGGSGNGGKAGAGSPGTGNGGQPSAPKPPSPIPSPIHTPPVLPIQAPPCPIPPWGGKGDPCEGVRIQIRDLLFDLQRTAGNIPANKPEGVQEARQRRVDQWYKVHGQQLAALTSSLEGCHNLDCQGPPTLSFEFVTCLEKVLPPGIEASTVRTNIADTIQDLFTPIQNTLQKRFPNMPPLFVQPAAESWCWPTDNGNKRERGNVWHTTEAEPYLPAGQVGLQRLDHFLPSTGEVIAFRISYPGLKKLVDGIWIGFPRWWTLDGKEDLQGPIKLEELSLSFPPSGDCPRPDSVATTVLQIKGSYHEPWGGDFTITATDTLSIVIGRDANTPDQIGATTSKPDVEANEIVTKFVMGMFPIIPVPYQLMAYSLLFGKIEDIKEHLSQKAANLSIGGLIASAFRAINPLLLPRQDNADIAYKLFFKFECITTVDDHLGNAGIVISGWPHFVPRAPAVWVNGPSEIQVDSALQKAGTATAQYSLVPIELRRDRKTGTFPSVQWQVDGKDVPGATEESVSLDFDIRRLANVLPHVLTKTVSVKVQDADQFTVSSKDLQVQIHLVTGEETDRQGPHGKRLPPP